MSVPDQTPVADFLSLARLDGRAFVVLGAGNGMGRQAAHALRQAGATVVCVDQVHKLADAVAGELDGVPLAADITQRAEVERVFATAAQQAGPIRGVVDVVGIATNDPILDATDETWRSQFEIVVDHAFLALQVGGRAIARAGGGAMVFVGSISGLATIENQSVYGAAKAALHHLVACAGTELAGSGVRVNAVAPGFVRTPRLLERMSAAQWEAVASAIPRGAAGETWEIAAPILFLASDLASYVSGQVLAVDGGTAGTLRFESISGRT